MKAKQPDMNEMLNAYMDGELEPRQAVEFKRLVENTPDLRARLTQLQAIRGLVQNLPQEDSPEELAGQVHAMLERKALFGESNTENRAFKRASSLIFQRIRAVAAVLTLGAVLTFLVYSIVSPVTPETANLADSDLSSVLSEQVPMRGKLELVCSTLPTVDSFLMRSAQFNELGSFIQKEEENGELVYHVSCHRDQIKPLLSDLSSIWHQFEETAFFVNTGELGQSVQIDRVSVAQVASLIDEQDSLKRIEYAKLEAVRNSMHGQPNSESFLAKDDSNGFPPMPMLTSGEPNKSESTDTNDPLNRVELTIVLKQKTL